MVFSNDVMHYVLVDKLDVLFLMLSEDTIGDVATQ